MKIQYTTDGTKIFAAVKAGQKLYIKAYIDEKDLVFDHQMIVDAAKKDAVDFDEEKLLKEADSKRKKNSTWAEEELSERYHEDLDELGFKCILARELPKNVQDLLTSTPWFPLDRLYGPL